MLILDEDRREFFTIAKTADGREVIMREGMVVSPRGRC